MDHSAHHHKHHNPDKHKGSHQKEHASHDEHREHHTHDVTNRETQNHAIHNKHAGHHTADFLKRFWICLFVTIPVLLLSHMVQLWLGFNLRFAGDQYALLILSSFIYLYGGIPFLKGFVNEVKHNAIGMMTLVAMAITVAYVYSVAVVFGLKGMDFFWELATLIDIMLLGHWLEMRSQMSASNALQSLVALLPSQVHVERNSEVIDISINELKKGDIAIVKPGEQIPADGIVTDGRSFVNESMLTGESQPVNKEKDSKLIAGSLNGDGILKIKVTGAGKESYLNKVIKLVESAQGDKSRTQNLADRVAKWLTIISIVVGVITFVLWIFRNDLPFALERMVTVMVTSCPHALGVAIPLVVAISTTSAATHGLLIRNRTAFETARKLTTIIFDKTGTLTKGSHEVQRIFAISSRFSETEILQYTASVQQNSEHYIARGIMKSLKNRNLQLWPSSDFNYMPGIGVSARVNDKTVVAAGPNYFKKVNKPLPEIPSAIDQNRETINFILIDGEPVGIITLADSIRDSAKDSIKKLKEMGIKSFLLTGDNERIAASVASELEMDGYLANVLPHEKQEKVKEFKDRGEIVAMTGDGVNDAPALAAADVGIALGSGTDVAAETADILLVNSEPKDVVSLIEFARKTYRKMIQNLGWAIGYNVIAIPLAAGVLYPYFTLSPAMGAVLMSLSTVIVAINARLLKLK